MNIDPTTALTVAAAGAAIPLVVAFLTKLKTSPLVKSLVSVLLAGLTAVGAHLADVKGLNDWKAVLAAGIAASVAAGGTLASTWGDTVTAWIHAKTDDLLG